MIELAVVTSRPVAEIRGLSDVEFATMIDVLVERSRR
jgi:hypothetical protein